MSPVEARLAELRAALGDRLPPAVHEVRLREARAHLLASAEEVGEAEAARRFGRARVVANDLVRAHRGYDGRSAWNLALPLGGAMLLYAAGRAALIVLGPEVASTAPFLQADRAVLLAFVLAFVARAAQTRRWLAGPVAAAHVAALVLTVAVGLATPERVYLAELRDGTLQQRILSPEETQRFLTANPKARRDDGLSREQALGVAAWGAAYGAAWLLANAAALGAAGLLDLRRVRRIRGTR